MHNIFVFMKPIKTTFVLEKRPIVHLITLFNSFRQGSRDDL